MNLNDVIYEMAGFMFGAIVAMPFACNTRRDLAPLLFSGGIVLIAIHATIAAAVAPPLRDYTRIITSTRSKYRIKTDAVQM